jgi:hypothetical protein
MGEIDIGCGPFGTVQNMFKSPRNAGELRKE